MSGETTRRGLIARAIAAGAGAGLLGPSDAGAAQVPAGDSALLHTVLASELLAVYCYQRVLASGLLDGRTMRLATQVLVQERAHVRAVRGALAASGGVPPQAPASPAAADRELSILLVPNRLAELHNREDARKLLIALEGPRGCLLCRDRSAERPRDAAAGGRDHGQRGPARRAAAAPRPRARAGQSPAQRARSGHVSQEARW